MANSILSITHCLHVISNVKLVAFTHLHVKKLRPPAWQLMKLRPSSGGWLIRPRSFNNSKGDVNLSCAPLRALAAADGHVGLYLRLPDDLCLLPLDATLTAVVHFASSLSSVQHIRRSPQAVPLPFR
jgi:hypothetical protein